MGKPVTPGAEVSDISHMHMSHTTSFLLPEATHIEQKQKLKGCLSVLLKTVTNEQLLSIPLCLAIHLEHIESCSLGTVVRLC